MKRIILACTLSMSIFTATAQSYVQNIKKFRAEQIKDFKGENSPVSEDNIKFINYFPIDESYKVIADLELISNDKTLKFPTSDGSFKLYKVYGKLKFEIAHKAQELTLYYNASSEDTYLFLPFNDLTNGNITYGGGRYIDVKKTDIINKKISLDFNTAYNPYCAYSDGFRCPLPPRDNVLDIAIQAGEKIYKGPRNVAVLKKKTNYLLDKAAITLLSDSSNTKSLHVLQTTNETEHIILKKVSQDISLQDPNLPLLIKRMQQTVQAPENDGVGIAAPQIGLNVNLFLVQRYDKKEQPFQAFINPRITWRSTLQQLGPEGCLSIADIRGDVYRSYAIKIHYYDIQGIEKEELIEGFTAVIIQHEMDHLLGILFTDRLEQQKDKQYQVQEKLFLDKNKL